MDARTCWLGIELGQGVFSRFFRIFSRFFRETGLTKWGFGCNLYSTGSKKDRCSPQKRYSVGSDFRLVGAGSEEKSKNLSKVA